MWRMTVLLASMILPWFHQAAAQSKNEEQRFDRLTEEFVVALRPFVAQFGVGFSAQTKWKDDMVNAAATHIGDWRLLTFGGLFRALDGHEDAYSVALCHEVGHLAGGFPFSHFPRESWSSSDGQADYFAAQVCLPKLWDKQLEVNQARYQEASDIVRRECDQALGEDSPAAHLCARISSAAKLALETLMHAELAFDKPDRDVVTTTNFGYPSPQCRLDTYLAAARCDVRPEKWAIAGLTAPDINGMEAEHQALSQSCHVDYKPWGARPTCWFHERH